MAIPTEPTLSTRIRPLKRAEGKNAVRFAAYISGSQLTCERTGETFDYRYRKPIIEFSEILAPDGAPGWARNRQELWNRAENIEKRKDSQVARDFRFWFSYDLTPEQRQQLAREVAQEEFVSKGMVADVAIHLYGEEHKASRAKTAELVAKWQSWGIPFLETGDAGQCHAQHVLVTRKRDGGARTYQLFQPHCHIELTMRPITEDGESFDKKSAGSVAREWNDQKAFEGIRERVAARQNAALETLGSERRLDHRGYEDRREEALQLAEDARGAGRLEEAGRQALRAEMLLRQPEPYLGVARRVKQLTGFIRSRVGDWIAVRHRNRLLPEIDAIEKRGAAEFVRMANGMIDRTARTFGIAPPPPAPERGMAYDR